MQMPRGVGKALEKAITTKEGSSLEGAKGETKFEFMNKSRQEIFQFLCLHPCSNTTTISKATGLSLHATSWHLRRLVESDFVSKKTMGKKTVFYPVNMISTKDIPILEILNTDKAKAIYLAILEKKGISQKEICEMIGLKHQAVIWYTKKLESLGLISSLEDGKFRRYYPTELLFQKKEENSKRIKIFKDEIIKRFHKQRLSPTILRSTQEKIVVRIARGGSRAVLTLNMNPFLTVLS